MLADPDKYFPVARCIHCGDLYPLVEFNDDGECEWCAAPD